MVLLNDGKLK